MSESCTIRRIDRRVHLVANGTTVGLDWSHGLALGAAVRRIGAVSRDYATHARATGDLTRITHDKEVVDELRIVAAGPAVVIELRDRQWFAFNYRDAPVIANAILSKARECEELAKADQIVSDQAILLRTPLGQLIGLSDNKQIQQAAWKQAEDVKLPGMIEPTHIVGAPVITQSQPGEPCPTN